MNEQQVCNYLLWLKERGQGYIVPGALSAPSNADQDAPLVEDVQPPLKAELMPSLKVIFLSLTPLHAPEHEMVARIAAALSLRPDDFAIVAGAEAKALTAAQERCFIIVMGEEAGTLISGRKEQTLLSIPHPGAMLKEPRLKVSAWETLQKLKAAL